MSFPDSTVALDLNASPLFCFLFLLSTSIIITVVGFHDQDLIPISAIESYSLLESKLWLKVMPIRLWKSFLETAAICWTLQAFETNKKGINDLKNKTKPNL